MEQAATYFLKSALCTLIFLSIYSLFLKNETFYKFNRHFLLAGLLCSLLLPFYTYTHQAELVISATLEGTRPVNNIGSGTKELWVYILPIVYSLGVIFLIIRNLRGLLAIRLLLRKEDRKQMPWGTLWATPAFGTSFSVFNNIIIDPSPEISPAERKMVFEHELAHVKQRHWADLLLAQLFCIINWFNPLPWLYLKAVKQNHEFLADRSVLQKGNSIAVYRAALINHVLGIPVFTFASTFAKNDRLMRVRMMGKTSSRSLNKLAVLITLPALTAVLWAFAKTEYTIKPASSLANNAVESNIAVNKPKDTSVEEANPQAQGKLPVFRGNEKSAARAPKKTGISSEKTSLVNKKQSNPTIIPSEKPEHEPAIEIKDEPANALLLRSSSFELKPQPLFLLDGKEVGSMVGISTDDIDSIRVFKDATAIALYGEKGKNGVVEITSKK